MCVCVCVCVRGGGGGGGGEQYLFYTKLELNPSGSLEVMRS